MTQPSERLQVWVIARGTKATAHLVREGNLYCTTCGIPVPQWAYLTDLDDVIGRVSLCKRCFSHTFTFGKEIEALPFSDPPLSDMETDMLDGEHEEEDPYV